MYWVYNRQSASQVGNPIIVPQTGLRRKKLSMLQTIISTYEFKFPSVRQSVRLSVDTSHRA